MMWLLLMRQPLGGFIGFYICKREAVAELLDCGAEGLQGRASFGGNERKLSLSTQQCMGIHLTPSH